MRARARLPSVRSALTPSRNPRRALRRHDGERLGLWGPGVLSGPANRKVIAALENDKKRQGLVAATQATFEPREQQRAQQALRFFDSQVAQKKRKFLIEFFRGARFMERLERDMAERRAARKVAEAPPKPGRTAAQRAEKLLLKEARLFFTGRLGWGGEADPEWGAVLAVADAPERIASLIERANVRPLSAPPLSAGQRSSSPRAAHPLASRHPACD